MALAVILCIGIAGCAPSQEDALVYLNYGTGMDAYGRYNSQLFGMNGQTDPDGADPGVFYVSPEEDAQWGGYYYRYITSEMHDIPQTEYYQTNEIVSVVAQCDRSKDLFHWETVGALVGGYSLQIEKKDWCGSNYWAPEVIRNPADGKYYMYFNASAKTDMGLNYISNSENAYDRFYIGVAVADTPVGPFSLICDFDSQNGTRIPTINFQTGYGLDYNIAAIDAHPFFDANGELYLYFVRHPDDNHSGGNVLAGMKMQSMAYPDYETATIIAAPGVSSVKSTAGDLLNYTRGEAYYSDESGVNEGPFMYLHNGTYYLTYSSNGYESPSYSVHQAVGQSPLGPFTKLSMEAGNPVMDGTLFGDVYGTAHHSLVKNGDSLWIVYHRHCSIIHGVGWERPTAADRVNFVLNGDGVEVMTSNGPSRTLTWLPENVSGYENLASSAQITVSSGKGVQYLTDSVLPLYEVTQNHKLAVKEGDVTITLTWPEPVSVSALMIYNAALPEQGFSQIADIRFKLAEKPAWASQKYAWAVIQNLPIQQDGWDAGTLKYLECAPAVAEFDRITVTQIQITIAEKDRLMKHTKLGDVNTAVDVSEIVVLGGNG